MRQANYENIIACIQFGAPAMADQLIADFNESIEQANNFIQYEAEAKAEAEKARIAAEKEKIDAERKQIKKD